MSEIRTLADDEKRRRPSSAAMAFMSPLNIASSFTRKSGIARVGSFAERSGKARRSTSAKSFSQ